MKEPWGLSWGQKKSSPTPYPAGMRPSRSCFQNETLTTTSTSRLHLGPGAGFPRQGSEPLSVVFHKICKEEAFLSPSLPHGDQKTNEAEAPVPWAFRGPEATLR